MAAKLTVEQIESLSGMWSGGNTEAAKAAGIKPKYLPYLSLPSHKLHELNKLIFSENKITQVVKILKEDLGLYKTTKSETLRLYLQEYKKDFKDLWIQFNMGKTVHVSQPVPAELKQHIPTSIADPKLAQWIPYGRVRVLLREAMAKYDAMTELERVTLMQYERVLKIWEYEQKLPTERTEEDGTVVPLLGLCEEGGREIQLLHTMLSKIVTLQMDLGIRHKEEKASQHLHIEFQKSHQDLMERFAKSKQFTNLTAEALNVIAGDLPPVERQEMVTTRNAVSTEQRRAVPQNFEDDVSEDSPDDASDNPSPTHVDITSSFTFDED